MSFVHHLTIGHFDPDLVSPWRRIVVRRALTGSEIEAIASAAAEILGHPVDLAPWVQPNGVLRILQYGDQRQAHIAGTVAEAAHRLFGAVAADRENGRVVLPMPATPPWPRLVIQAFDFGGDYARELVIDRTISQEDVDALERAASEGLATPVKVMAMGRVNDARVLLMIRADDDRREAEAILAAATQMFGGTVTDVPSGSRPWER